MEKRILTGKTQKISNEEKEKLKQERIKERSQFEETRRGGYELIYPSKNEKRNKEYDTFIQKANDLWDEFTTGNKGKKLKEQQQLEKKTTIGPRNQNKIITQTTQNRKQSVAIEQGIKAKQQQKGKKILFEKF